MKRLVILAAVAALASCGQKASTDATETTVTADGSIVNTPTPGATMPATGEMAGVYEVTSPDGTVITETIMADGTYTDLANGKETSGTWRLDGERSCFDPEGEAAEVCYTTSAPATDGSFTATAPDGTKTTIRKTGAAPNS